MKVVLLAGGFGTRISEESQYKPKPMIEIGGMPMWMCHTFLSIYLFPNFIYGFRYPLLIFVVLTALSYAISIVVLKSSAVLENLVGLSTTRSTRK